jgi:hypothetical protein
VSGDAGDTDMKDETNGPNETAEPVVESNGPWFVVFMVGIVLLLAAAFAAVIHSLSATFR